MPGQCDPDYLSTLARSLPELTAGNARAFGHGRELGPDHVRVDRSLANPGAVAAVAAGNHIFTTHQIGVAGDALGNQFWMQIGRAHV